MDLSDAELMLLVQQGDEDAFSDLIERYEKRLTNFFYHMGWDYHLSEDLTQEVFIRVFRYRKKYRETAKFQTFIFRIAKNLWIDHIRRLKSHPRALSLDVDVSQPGEGGALKDILHDETNRTASQRVNISEISRAIKAAVETLSEQDKLIFMLVTKEGMKYKDIAEMLGIPEGTVKSKVYYTYRKLREKLEELKPDGM